jgi:Domain of unknown function (DUF4266)
MLGAMPFVHRMFLASLLAASACAASACAVVRPHERENLARPSMVSDRATGELRSRQHQTGAREGADGGTGAPGGGCGCN